MKDKKWILGFVLFVAATITGGTPWHGLAVVAAYLGVLWLSDARGVMNDGTD